jgi:hypothetical protein
MSIFLLRLPDARDVVGTPVFGTAILERVCLPTAMCCHLDGGEEFGASPFWQLSGKQSA